LDVEMVQKIVGFLAYVHGLQALLPATHPYKSDYPVAEVGLAPPEITPIPPFPLLLDNMILHDPVDGYNPTHRHFLGGVVTVNGAPARKRIVLSHRDTTDRIAVTKSDSATGEWQLSHLPEYPERSLTVTAFDDSGEFNAEIFDHISQVTAV